MVVATLTGDLSARPTADLPTGPLFWRAFGRRGAVESATPSPTWEFWVGTRSAPVDTAWGTTFDFNGDGYVDLAVGAPEADPGGRAGAGTVTVYQGTSEGLSRSPHRVLEGREAGENFGRTAGSAGDINGDGYADLLVRGSGAAGDSFSVFLGGAEGLSRAPPQVFQGYEGSAVGDVNGDGYADVASGQVLHEGSGRTLGLTVRLGNPDGLAEAREPIDTMAWSAVQYLAGPGDLNGDGYGDIFVRLGSVSDSRDLELDGLMLVYWGDRNWPAHRPRQRIETRLGDTRRIEDSFAGGDFNGDGFADLVIGAQEAQSELLTYRGSAEGLQVPPLVVRIASGTVIVGAGDLTGDGYTDLAVGDPAASRGGLSGVGAVAIHSGGPMGLEPTPHRLLAGDYANDRFGYAVGCAGDLDRNGYVDLVVGAPGAARSGGARTGSAAVFCAGPTGVSSVPCLTLWGASPDDEFGRVGDYSRAYRP